MIYIQSADGLTQVSPSLTKEKIIAALGYTPADKNIFYEDESGALVITDEQGYVIARIDENGLTTTRISASAVMLNGEDLATKLESLGDIDLSNYYTKSEVDDALTNVSVDLTGYATEEYVDEAVAAVEHPTVDLSPYALAADVAADKVITDAHMSDEVIHVTEADRETWDGKSNFSGNYTDLNGAPNIVNDNEDEVVICDSQGNVILCATAEGLNVAAIYINGIRMDEPLWKFTIAGVEYNVTSQTQRWRDWVTSKYNTAGYEVQNNGTICKPGLSESTIKNAIPDDFIRPGDAYIDSSIT